MAALSQNFWDKKFTLRDVGKGVLEISPTGCASDDIPQGEEFAAYLKNEKTPHSYYWTLCNLSRGAHLRVKYDNITKPIAQIEIPVSEDGNEATGEDLKITTYFDKNRFEYMLRHIANEVREQTFLSVKVPNWRALHEKAQWYKASSSSEYHVEYELRLESDTPTTEIEIFATITLTPFESLIYISNDADLRCLNDSYWKYCAEHFAKASGLKRFLNMSSFTEAALLALFLSGKQWPRIPMKKGGRILYPNKATNDFLPDIFKRPDDPIFNKVLTFTLMNIEPKGEVEPDYTWYNLLSFTQNNEKMVGGLWGNRPLLFKESDFNVTIEMIGPKRSSSSQFISTFQETSRLFRFKVTYYSDEEQYTIDFGGPVNTSCSFSSTRAGIQMLHAGIFVLLKLFIPNSDVCRSLVDGEIDT